VIFSDVTKMVVARRWCWRQSESSAATQSTTTAIITIEGHHEQAHRDVQNAVTDILDLLQTYAGGTYQSAILTADNPAI
jgi:DNA/RNA-binding domain of Phe-tRNA-synthetase-like protein